MKIAYIVNTPIVMMRLGPPWVMSTSDYIAYGMFGSENVWQIWAA